MSTCAAHVNGTVRQAHGPAAKRKDIVGERLAKVTMPPEPVLPALPSTQEESASQVASPQLQRRHQRGG
jgi:hypothetical protein